jgi:hypothetical protein
MNNDRKNEAIAWMTKRKDLRDLTVIQAYIFLDDFRQEDLVKAVVCRYIIYLAPSGWMCGDGNGGKHDGATMTGGELAGIY